MTAARPGRRRRTVVSLALVAIIVAIPMGTYFWGRKSGSFVVKTVAVSGQRRVSRREVERCLESRYLGENLFTITVADVRETLSIFPYVADVAVDRDYPETLRVRLTEYRPAALLLADGAWYVLSTDGRVVARLEPPGRREGDSPRPTPSSSTSKDPEASPSDEASPAGTSAATPLPGRTLPGPLPAPPRRLLPAGMLRLPIMATDMAVEVGDDVGDPQVLEGLAMTAALPPGLRRDVVAARVTDVVARLYFRPALEVEFGGVDGLQIKVLSLQAVLRRYRARHVRATFVDVSVPDRPLGSPLLPTPGAP